MQVISLLPRCAQLISELLWRAGNWIPAFAQLC